MYFFEIVLFTFSDCTIRRKWIVPFSMNSKINRIQNLDVLLAYSLEDIVALQIAFALK